jgi:hypothetical protein
VGWSPARAAERAAAPGSGADLTTEGLARELREFTSLAGSLLP